MTAQSSSMEEHGNRSYRQSMCDLFGIGSGQSSMPVTLHASLYILCLRCLAQSVGSFFIKTSRLTAMFCVFIRYSTTGALCLRFDIM